MTKNIQKILVPLTVGATLLGFLVTAPLTFAHQDPVGCSASGVGLSLTAFRSDGTTPIGGGLVAQGETIVYKATLSHLGGTNCNFEGGTLSITTPNGAVNTVASPATPVVPLVTSGSPFTSVGVNYVVAYANSGGDGILDATSNYSGGTSHTPNVDSTVGANNGISVVMEGRIIVDKVSNPSSEQDFEFDPSWGVNFFLDDTDAPMNSGSLALGSYSVAEVNLPAGWNLTNTNCVSSIGDNEIAGSLELDAGETITCTFTNTQNGNIIVVKDAVPNNAQNFTFTNNFGNSNPAAFDLDDDADGTLSNSRNSAVLPGTYAVSEGAVIGWTQTSAICNDGSPINAVVVSPGETVTCTFTNTLQQGHIIVDKVTNPSGDPQSFTFTTTGSGYAGFNLMDASTPNDQALNAGTYSVAETPVSGWTQTSVTCTSSLGGNENPASINLTGGETVTCTFVNTKEVRQYCSPGYWKQSQHFDSYVTYAPTDSFFTVFGVNAFPGKTLVQVLSTGGGGLTAFGRAAVGALLNASALNSGMTPSQVISYFVTTFNNAPSGNSNGYYGNASGTYTAPENCPLN